jgi:hypothetical protein
MTTEINKESIKAKARVTRFFSFVMGFLASVISIVEMVDFNKSAITEASVNLPNLISLTTEPSLLAYASILTLGFCLFSIIKSTNKLGEE